jgi:hypothetical protein
MVFISTFNNISVISWQSVYWWRKPEDPEKTTELSQTLSNNVVHLISPRSRFKIKPKTKKDHYNVLVFVKKIA